MLRIRAIDSHTAGEPTRVVLAGEMLLEGSSMVERREDFRDRFDGLRSGIVREPRGADVLVGAVLTPPVSEGATAGVVFCNNGGYIGMCGHGTIGVVETLRYLGLVKPGLVKLDTPVGPVEATLDPSGEVSLRNVPSYRLRKHVEIDVPGVGPVAGDVAYGGNWFFIVKSPKFNLCGERASELTRITVAIMDELEAQGIRADGGGKVDHIELYGAPEHAGSDSRNFVLCPGGAYDRSPCGTGTSAKLACLYEDGELPEGAWYVQESFTGTTFRGKIDVVEGKLIPTIVGRAYVTAELTLLFSDDDPLRWGAQ